MDFLSLFGSEKQVLENGKKSQLVTSMPSIKNSSKMLEGPTDPYRDDLIIRLGLDGQPNGLYSRVKQILSHDRRLELYEILDDGNRNLYVSQCGNDWIEVEID